MTVFSLTQGFLTGLPIAAVARGTPETFYLILAFLIFGVCAVVLCLIFIPKILMQHRYGKMSISEQKEAMKASVQMSARITRDFTGTAAAAGARMVGGASPRFQEGNAADVAIPENEPREEHVSSLTSRTDESGGVVVKPTGRRLLSSYLDESDEGKTG